MKHKADFVKVEKTCAEKQTHLWKFWKTMETRMVESEELHQEMNARVRTGEAMIRELTQRCPRAPSGEQKPPSRTPFSNTPVGTSAEGARKERRTGDR